MANKVWTKHYQIEWENRAADPNVPLWARVVALAYGRHEANGHANFRRGQLSWIFGTPAEGGKPFKRRNRDSIRDAINTCVKYGFLAEGSCMECLVVPYHSISGPMGDESKPCLVHERKVSRKRPAQPRLRLVE